MTTPLLLPPFVSSFNRLFIFPSINTLRTQPARAVEGLLDLPNTTTITTRGSLGRIFILVSSPPAYTVGTAVCYKFMALLWA